MPNKPVSLSGRIFPPQCAVILRPGALQCPFLADGETEAGVVMVALPMSQHLQPSSLVLAWPDPT